MNLNELQPAEGSKFAPKRVGRGIGSGTGKTSGKGHKGQNARSGGGVRPGFEGGQMPLYRRLPKRGFKNIFAKQYVAVNVEELNKLEDGAEVTAETLKANGIISKTLDGASEISVILNTGDEFTAKLVGQDTKTDLAVLKIDPGSTKLTAATLGDSTTVQVGETAVAIGNPMGQEFSGSVTSGIISAVNRTMNIDNRTYNLLQTDAAINSGNSGGALINQYGEVIGINSVKLSTTGVEGMGFAIAISEAKPIIDDLMASGYVTGRPLVGIGIKDTGYGLFIGSVSEGSGAAEAGLKVNDMILEVDGQKVSSTEEVNEIRDKKKAGDYLTFKILRDGETMEVQVRLMEDSADKTK